MKSSWTASRIRCLRRTAIAEDFGKRIIDPRELVGVFDGPVYTDAAWDWLKANGYVVNGRGMSVRLTPKGERELARVGRRP